MTREEYRQMRLKDELDVRPFYEFYVENVKEGEMTLPLHIFDILFKQWTDRPDVPTNKVVQKIVEDLDSKYNIVVLTSKEGKILKVF